VRLLYYIFLIFRYLNATFCESKDNLRFTA
jgi:hypothetical protein